jgi:hypothetical protein
MPVSTVDNVMLLFSSGNPARLMPVGQATMPESGRLYRRGDQELEAVGEA